jgi:Flp pilus assembly protein TadD
MKGSTNRSRAAARRSPDLSSGISGWVSLALALLAIAPYLQTLRYGFVNFDDPTYVADNAIVRQGLSWGNVIWAFTTMWGGNWHPLTWLSHMLDCQLFGAQPGWHHFVNALFHAANTALLFAVLRDMTGALWRSALVAALFAVHPLHVESVAWISERKDVLSTFFGLWAIWGYVRYTRSASLTRYAFVAGFFALSLLSKPMLVTLPFVLLLLDIWPLQRFWDVDKARISGRDFVSLFVEKLPLLAMSAVSCVVTFKAQHAAGAVAPVELLSISHRFANAIVSYAGYLLKTFWPVDLAAIYALPSHVSVIATVLSFLLLLGVTMGVVVFGRKRLWLLVGWLWFLGTLVPVIGLIQVGDQAMADRYSYLPLIGVFIMIAWSLPLAKGGRTTLIATAAGVVLVLLTTVTYAQVQVWRDTRTLFEHAIKVTNGNFTAHNLLAGVCEQEGDIAGARAHIDEALRVRPNYPGARYNLGMILMREKNYTGAGEQFYLALQNNRSDPLVWNGLGAVNISLGQTDDAIVNYRHALELDPNYASALSNLANALVAKGKIDEAVEACEKALRIRPNVAETHATLGRALLAKGNKDQAIAQAEQALRLDPANESAKRVLADAGQR